jgi:glutaredoxin 3
MVKKIQVFTTNQCAYCHMVKKFLQTKNFDYEEINLDQFPQRRQEAINISGGMTVPVTLVTKEDDSKHVVVGFNLSNLVPLLS